MKTLGVIAEYNPFHNGHAHHIRRAKEETGCTACVVVMSGNFVQRGEPALFDKWARARLALLGGADLVLELPVPYALSSAEGFARGGVALLSALGVVDVLSFGSECGDIESLMACARALSAPNFSARLKGQLAAGLSFPAAREAALAQTEPALASLLRAPNNILGVEYCKALLSSGAPLSPHTLRREGARHDEPRPASGFASASALRTLLLQTPEQAAPFVPASTLLHLQNGDFYPQGPLYDALVLSVLRRLSADGFAALPDVSEGLENRLCRAAQTACSLDEFYALVKSKRYTLARLRRITACALCGVTRELTQLPPPYLRILGHNAAGRALLRAAAKKASLPLITKPAAAFRLGAAARQFMEAEQHAGAQFSLLRQSGPAPAARELTQGPVIL